MIAKAIFSIFAAVAAVDALTISDKSTNSSSSLLNGIVFEDINHSGDGGLYGELLANRAFQGSDPSVANYTGVDGATLTLADEPLGALPSSLYVEGDGFYNGGYWGIRVDSGTKYTARFYAKGNARNFKVSLKGVESGTEFAQATARKVRHSFDVYKAEQDGFHLYEATLYAWKSASDLNNGLYIHFSGGSGYFNIISLMGPNYRGRKNGLRNDIATTVDDMSAKFLRFPGANNLEGATPSDRWKWNETLGYLVNRPGREGDWTYANTDGLGLDEYFQWTSDMNLAPILALYAGYSLDSGDVAEDELQPYIDDALNELEYCLGDTSTYYGRLRAANGHKNPYTVKYVEIGNEDFLSDGYSYRWPMFRDAILEKYPDLILIATTQIGIEFPNDTETWWDQHHYSSPDWFVQSFSLYDNYPRNKTKIMVGEYAVTSFNNGTRMTYPTVEAAVSEATFMIGMERNSDQITTTCYAPVLQNFNSYQWTPDLIGFDAGSVTRSASYYVQQMFASTQGAKILALDGASFDPLYYVANINDQGTTIHIKITNPSSSSQTFTATIDVDGFSSASASAQGFSSSEPQSYNVPGETETITTQSVPVSYSNGQVDLSVGPYFVGVVTLTV